MSITRKSVPAVAAAALASLSLAGAASAQVAVSADAGEGTSVKASEAQATPRTSASDPGISIDPNLDVQAYGLQVSPAVNLRLGRQVAGTKSQARSAAQHSRTRANRAVKRARTQRTVRRVRSTVRKIIRFG